MYQKNSFSGFMFFSLVPTSQMTRGCCLGFGFGSGVDPLTEFRIQVSKFEPKNTEKEGCLGIIYAESIEAIFLGYRI